MKGGLRKKLWALNIYKPPVLQAIPGYLFVFHKNVGRFLAKFPKKKKKKIKCNLTLAMSPACHRNNSLLFFPGCFFFFFFFFFFGLGRSAMLKINQPWPRKGLISLFTSPRTLYTVPLPFIISQHLTII